MGAKPPLVCLSPKGQIDDIKDLIAKSNELGMVMFDQSLQALYERHRGEAGTGPR